MSYALSVYRVSWPLLDRAFAKHDQALLNKALEAVAERLADYDEQMGAPDLEYNDVDLSHAETLAEIFSGEFTEGVTGSRYGWAFECLCHFLGEPLSNAGLSRCNTQWYGQLDELLLANQIKLRFEDLTNQSPIPIPPADDWPCIGHWGSHAIAAIPQLTQLLPHIQDAQAREALATALSWLHAAEADRDSVIVGFHG